MATSSGNMNKSMLTTVIILFAITVVISFIPVINNVLYPFKLFSTFVHEMSHGLTAIATGGKWQKFVVNVDTSGYAITQGGLRTFVIPAGYLGTSLIGGILLLLGAKKGSNSKVILFIIGAILVLITVIFARNVLSIVVGLGFGVALGLVAMFTTGFFPALVLNYLAVNLSLNALLDVKTLFFHTAASSGNNDAVSMNREILGIGNITWAVIFVGLSLLITYLFLKAALRKGKASGSDSGGTSASMDSINF